MLINSVFLYNTHRQETIQKKGGLIAGYLFFDPAIVRTQIAKAPITRDIETGV
jgi:hypothetical protein